MLDEVVDSGDKIFDASETAATDRLLGDETKPSLDLVEPGGVGWSVVNLKSGPLCQPESYLGVLVSGIVVDDEVDREIVGHGLVDAFEEAKKLLMAMAWFAFGEDRPGSDVEGGKERGGAMANVVMSDSFHVTEAHRQHRLSAVEGLNLGLLIDRQHDGVIGRVEVKTHHISYLFHEKGIAGQLEIPRPVRLDGERPEDSMHGGF